MSDSSTTSTSEPHIPAENCRGRTSGADSRLKTAVVEITPRLARDWLERNRRNRRIREDRVERYGELMKDGEWLVSPDAIAFDYNGALINGQHRLKAIVYSKTPATCVVVLNLRPAAYKISDVGIKRTGADVLRIEGFKKPEELAATSRLIALWKRGSLEECYRYENVENSVIVEIASRCTPRLLEAIEMTSEDKREHQNLMPRSLMAFAYFIYQPSFPKRTKEFYNGFIKMEGEGLLTNWEDVYEVDGAENPIKLLREKMRDHYGDLKRDRKLGFLIKAMNYYCEEKPQKRLRYRMTDNFPEPACEMVPELGNQTDLHF